MTEAKRLSIEKLKKEGHFARIGGVGGRANYRTNGRAHMVKIGKRAGEAVKDLYGNEHFKKIAALPRPGKRKGEDGTS